MKELRKILRVSWTTRKTNEWVLNKAGVKRELLDTVKARRGAGRGGPGVRTPPPATARTTCEIRLNPRTFFMVRGGVSDNAVQNVYTAVCRTFLTFETVQRNA